MMPAIQKYITAYNAINRYVIAEEGRNDQKKKTWPIT